jgi:predicted MFS family arabinose efflux permease
MMLTEVHGLDPQVSTLIYVLNGVGLVFATPLAGYLIKYNVLSRRAVAYVGFLVLSVGMFIRTGDFFAEPMLWMAILGQIVSGMGITVMKVVSLPELVDSVELQPDLYAQLDI